MTAHQTYRFGPKLADGDASMKELLGGKGANLAEMAKLGLPVPPGVTIPTTLCTSYQGMNASARSELCMALAVKVLGDLQQFVVPEFGYLPLLSVRSGARVSMPGMMDTILNVGMTTANVAEWKGRIGHRAALDSYRRLIQMYGCTVHGMEHHAFEDILQGSKNAAGAKSDADLSADALEIVVAHYLARYENAVGMPFPQDVTTQLAGCIGAVFGSWENERAIEYRIANKIPHDWGTAVTVQSMVFGNMNDQSATGVLFTRNPNDGTPGLFGEFLINAQGEDVVAGIRTPEPLSKMEGWNEKVFDELVATATQMEAHARDMQDMEFTVQDGKLFILQTRNGKRSAKAAFKIAFDLASAETISWPDAVKRVTGKQYMALKRPQIDPKFATKPTVVGLPAAGSVVTGVAVMSAEAAKQSKVPCVLVTKETTPDDFGGMMASVGILTQTGGATSHAAVVARGMDKCCVVGASAMKLGVTVKAGDKVTIDGATGRVWVNIDVPVLAGGVTKEAAYIAKCAMHFASQQTGKTVRITLDPNDWQMQLPQNGTVVLNVAALARSARGRRHVRMLLDELEKRPELNGLLEFDPAEVGTHPSDVELLDMLGAASVTPKVEGFNVEKVGQAVAYAKWTKKLVGRWSITGPADLLAIAEERGFAVARTATKLGELMKGGAVEVGAQLCALLEQQDVEVSALIALIKKAGIAVSPMPKAVDEDTLMFAVLGK
ncbi:MAG TPA: PEP/pyruvate-binding domain-containing protein [Rhizobacter sp.]